ncbi:pyridoxal-dependent decarboxylase [Kineosporia sp. A_224]|uniref:pyridoxal phosphate-dependent decarboxylase family protein n=1 Tax=Kineosporia sp. A_224 TaxID=1962180 RepID=UPI000B4BD476|nr:pyridoxal-dependent decarboxylase [Kineosporia sp. A_224]
MDAREEQYAPALDAARDHAVRWLRSLDERPVRPQADADAVAATFGGDLPEDGCDPAAVVDLLAAGAEPGLMAMPAGRFFGWVIGGTHPAALATDWLVSAWDQNNALRYASPATAALEEVAARWLLDLLGLPAGADVGFVTGATTANFTCLAAARSAVLAKAGWDVGADGLTGAPRVHVLVGRERHETVDLALRHLGLGSPAVVDVDDEGRIRTDALAAALAAVPEGSPVVVCLQAGNIHSGAFDPFAAAVGLAHERGAWVHVDGAFGLWAAASPSLRHLVAGVAAADSWATDAHKTLNVPYDCGVAVVADPTALRTAMGMRSSYLVADDTGPGDPHDKVPELSRRARGVPVWAVLRALGRRGVADLVDRLAARARELADGIGRVDGAQVLNDVVFTQVCVAFEDDARTREVIARLLEGGHAWMSGSRWRGRHVLRVSVSNWSTDADDVRRSVAAVRVAASP